MRLLIVCLLTFMTVVIFAQKRASESMRPKYLKAKYNATHRWNTQQMVPYSGTLNVEIDDTVVIISTSYSERPDTFIFNGIRNNHFSYGKREKYRYQYFWISPDSMKVQRGEPMGVNYFYRIDTIYADKKYLPRICPKCQGSGRIKPNPKFGGPDESVGICPKCGGNGKF